MTFPCRFAEPENADAVRLLAQQVYSLQLLYQRHFDEYILPRLHAILRSHAHIEERLAAALELREHFCLPTRTPTGVDSDGMIVGFDFNLAPAGTLSDNFVLDALRDTSTWAFFLDDLDFDPVRDIGPPI